MKKVCIFEKKEKFGMATERGKEEKWRENARRKNILLKTIIMAACILHIPVT